MMKISKLLTITALLAAVSAAQAATVTYTGTMTVGVTNESVNVTQFDNGVGGVYAGDTLNSVTLQISGASIGTANCVNSDPVVESWEITQTATTSLKFTVAGTTVQANPTYDQFKAVAASATTPISMNTGNASGSTVLTSGSANLSPYQGNSYVSAANVQTKGSWGADGLGVGDTFGPTSQSFTLTWTVTYDYTPVPEPATVGLLAIGGLVLGLRRRFAKKA